MHLMRKGSFRRKYFLIQKEKVTSRHNIRLIEVKTTPTVLHAADYKVQDGITYLPLYMAPLL